MRFSDCDWENILMEWSIEDIEALITFCSNEIQRRYAEVMRKAAEYKN